MRSINSNLLADILNGTICTLITITLADGTKYYYTDHDQSITIGLATYDPAPGLQKIKYTATANAEVSNQEFGSAWVDAPEADLIAGRFDMAWIEVAWASWKNPSYGRFITFTGQLGEITWDEEGFRADIVSSLKNLAKSIGAQFTANCRHDLFSGPTQGLGEVGACGLTAASYKVSGTVDSVLTAKWKFNVSLPSGADGYFSNGTVTFTSGSNSGLSFVCKVHRLVTGQHSIELFLPTAFVVNAGDTFDIWAGCNKTAGQCKDKFNNIANFGGFPHIQQEVTIR